MFNVVVLKVDLSLQAWWFCCVVVLLLFKSLVVFRWCRQIIRYVSLARHCFSSADEFVCGLRDWLLFYYSNSSFESNVFSGIAKSFVHTV